MTLITSRWRAVYSTAAWPQRRLSTWQTWTRSDFILVIAHLMESSGQHSSMATEEIVNMADLDKVRYQLFIILYYIIYFIILYYIIYCIILYYIILYYIFVTHLMISFPHEEQETYSAWCKSQSTVFKGLEVLSQGNPNKVYCN